ncbi:MAG: P1 family peptidase [Actinobacteria bacterium]|nr:P1 family peptidase [Actinomycetota bacterium]
MAGDPLLRTPAGRERARGLGVPFEGRPGAFGAITDVPGVEVGHATVIAGEGARTGVTAIHPRGRADPGDPCAAGMFSFNGNGEMTGAAWVEESGTASLPITLTNTHAVGAAHAGTVAWVARHHPALAELWLLPIVAETWDGVLNDINGGHVTEEVVHAALDGARPGPVEEGSVGGGTGMVCYGFKGGAGTASRLVAVDGVDYTFGAYVQANFGAPGEFVLAGVPVGRALAEGAPGDGAPRGGPPPGAGSVIVVLATDAPLLAPQCKALARRAVLGLGRTGTSGSHFSGDLVLAFSTANPGAFRRGIPGGSEGAAGRLDFLQWDALDPCYRAVVEAVEEAVLNALVANQPMTGKGGATVPALPHDRVRALLAAAGRLDGPA